MGQRSTSFRKMKESIDELNVSELLKLIDNTHKLYGSFELFIRNHDSVQKFGDGFFEILIKSKFHSGLKIFILNEIINEYKFPLSTYERCGRVPAMILVEMECYDIDLHKYLIDKKCKVDKSVVIGYLKSDQRIADQKNKANREYYLVRGGPQIFDRKADQIYELIGFYKKDF